MKRRITLLIVVALLMACLAGCAKTGSDAKDVDLSAFFKDIEESYEVGVLADISEELLDSYYPGLSEIATKQFVGKMPNMSAVVSEFVFVQCEKEADAEKVETILKDRVTAQAEGGAWYPDSMEAWAKAEVIREGSYVAMIASGEFGEEIVADFNALFA